MHGRELRKVLKGLPVIPIGTIAENHQIVEGSEDGVHYKITKEFSPRCPEFVVYALSVSGEKEKRYYLISRFVKLLGSPLNKFQSDVLPGIEFVCWDAKKIDKEETV